MENKAFFMNLPSEITTNIFSRLPIKTVGGSKCVCRKWLNLLSSLEFAELHFSASSTPGLVVYQLEADTHSCKIIEFEDELPELHENHDHDLHYKQVLKFDPTSFISTSYAILMEGSVNGFLCLHHWVDESLDAFYICNPIMREYVKLPLLKGKLYPNVSTYGFGVSSSSGLYKLVRINHGPIETRPNIKIPDFVCHVYTLGTSGSWRIIEPGLCHYTYSFNSVFLNGYLHWLAQDDTDRQLVSCFDLETELFDRFILPPSVDSFTFPVTLSILWDCLCFCESSGDEEIVIWVMKDYGVEKSWMKEIVISKEVGDLGGLTNHDCVYPLKVFGDGDILFLHGGICLFYYSSKTETAPEVEMFKMDDRRRFEAILHTSSFMSLKRFRVENVASF